MEERMTDTDSREVYQCKHCGNDTIGVEVADHLRPMCSECWHRGVHLAE